MPGQLKIINGFYQSDSLPLANQQCMNLYPHIPETEGGFSQQSLFAMPGIDFVFNALAVAGNSCRGAILMDGVPYIVVGYAQYKWDQYESFSQIDIAYGSGFVSMATNGEQLVTVTEGGVIVNLYTVASGSLNLTAGTTPYLFSNGTPISVDFIDGYFVFCTDEDKIIVSDINDVTSGSSLNYSGAEYDPDSLVRTVVVKNQLMAIGASTCEEFQNVGGTGFPFKRTGTFFDVGTPAPFSVIKLPSSFAMVGVEKNGSPRIYAYADNELVPISTACIDNILKDYTENQLYECAGFLLPVNGEKFLVFTFYDRTIAFNLKNQLWFELSSYIEGEQTPWRCLFPIKAYGNLYCGDIIDGRIGKFSNDLYGEYSSDVRKWFTTSVLHAQGKPFSIQKIELDMEIGVGNSDVVNPQVGMQYSDDGVLFGDNVYRSAGEEGQRDTRLIWRNIKRCQKRRTYRFNISDQVKTVIHGITIE